MIVLGLLTVEYWAEIVVWWLMLRKGNAEQFMYLVYVDTGALSIALKSFSMLTSLGVDPPMDM